MDSERKDNHINKQSVLLPSHENKIQKDEELEKLYNCS